MARKISFEDTFEDAGRVKATWQTIPDFAIGEIHLADFRRVHDEARAFIDDYTKKKAELLAIKINRDNKIRDLSNLLTRFRRSVFAAFGPDSVKYAQAGGTRGSERKAYKRKSSVNRKP